MWIALKRVSKCVLRAAIVTVFSVMLVHIAIHLNTVTVSCPSYYVHKFLRCARSSCQAMSWLVM